MTRLRALTLALLALCVPSGLMAPVNYPEIPESGAGAQAGGGGGEVKNYIGACIEGRAVASRSPEMYSIGTRSDLDTRQCFTSSVKAAYRGER